MMKFVVTAESDLMDAHFETNDVDEACEMYEKFCESREVVFHDVNFYDGETGELYAYQTIERDPEGITITQWLAN
jgi:pentatricopeptide repeat protein